MRLNNDDRYVIRTFLTIFGAIMSFGGLYMMFTTVRLDVLNQNVGWIIVTSVGAAMLLGVFWSVRKGR